jgi:hypothetical protein
LSIIQILQQKIKIPRLNEKVDRKQLLRLEF